MEMTFKPATETGEIKAVFEHNIDAFSDSPDFPWTLQSIKAEIAEGWELMAAIVSDEIVAGLFIRQADGSLYTKNTALKQAFQGSGYSHKIKQYYEKVAKERKLKRIYHYCRIDNFRMYSLNESHGYKKTGRQLDPQGQIVEWMKSLT